MGQICTWTVLTVNVSKFKSTYLLKDKLLPHVAEEKAFTLILFVRLDIFFSLQVLISKLIIDITIDEQNKMYHTMQLGLY